MNWKEQLNKGIGEWIKLNQGIDEYSDIKVYLEEIREDLQDELILIITGEFNAGKSTFINALLGENILKMNVLPETAVVTKIKYGKDNKIIARFLNGTVKEYTNDSFEELTAERKGEFENIRKELSYIEIQLPKEILKTFTIIDTPGLSALNDAHTNATERYLKRADIALWISHYDTVGRKTEKDWLEKFHSYNITPTLVVNKIDFHDEEEDDLEEILQENFRKLSPLISNIIGVSAKDALEGKMEGNKDKLQWSNWRNG